METINKYLNRENPMVDNRSGDKETRIIQRYHELKMKICGMKDEIKRKEKNIAIRKKVKSLCPSARPVIKDVIEDIKKDLKKKWNFPVLKMIGDILGSLLQL